jgi:hypothetical protein
MENGGLQCPSKATHELGLRRESLSFNSHRASLPCEGVEEMDSSTPSSTTRNWTSRSKARCRPNLLGAEKSLLLRACLASQCAGSDGLV